MVLIRGRAGFRPRVPGQVSERAAWAIAGAVLAAAFVAYFAVIAVVVVQARGGAL